MKPAIGFFSLLIILHMAGCCIAKPLFVMTGNSSKTTAIFLANANSANVEHNNHQKIKVLSEIKFKTKQPSEVEIVSMIYVGTPKIKYPISAYAGFMDYRQKHQKRHPIVYALAKKGKDCDGIIYQFDANTGEEIFAYPLHCPIMKGTVLVEDVYYANAWHSLLLIESIDTNGKTNPLLLIEITDPKLEQKPMRTIEVPDFAILATPKIVRTKLGVFGILFGGKIIQNNSANGVGTVRFIPLDLQAKETKEGKEIVIKIVSNKGIINVLPIDLYSSGFLDKIYARDEAGILWSIDLQDRSRIECNGKVQMPIPTSNDYDSCRSSQSKILIAKSVDKPGIEFLTLENKVNGTHAIIRLFNQNQMLSHNNSSLGAVEKLERQVLAEGQYLDFYLFTHCLILIPKSFSQNPTLLLRTRKGYKPMPCEWRNLSIKQAMMPQRMTGEKKRLQAECFWGYKQNTIQIVTLDEDGALNILEPLLTSHHNLLNLENVYGGRKRATRVMWRKT